MQFSPGPPLVSVILPSFNHAAFVGEAVQVFSIKLFATSN